MKEKTREYQVMAFVAVTASISISAKSLSEAVWKSKELKETDFIDFSGVYINGEDYRVIGVYE